MKKTRLKLFAIFIVSIILVPYNLVFAADTDIDTSFVYGS